MKKNDDPMDDQLNVGPTAAGTHGARYKPLRPLDPDIVLTPAEAAIVEREKDLLVQLVARHLGANADVSSLGPNFLEWYAREAREGLSASERADLEREATAFADRMVQRAELARMAVARVDHMPPRSAAPDGEALTALMSLGRERRMVPILDLAVAAGAGRELWSEPCSEWLPLPTEVPDGQYLALTVRGDSMLPLLHSGDLILIRIGAELDPGAVVVVRHPDSGYVVKRVGAVTAVDVELRSLNAAYSVLRVPRDPSLVLGTVLLRWCAHEGKDPPQS